MSEDLQHFRWLGQRLPGAEQRRIVVMTGARQTGKTTLAKKLYADMRYVNLDAPEDRSALGEVRSAAWARTVGAAVLDEVQKAPGVFEKLKYAYDAGEISFSVLLGSSQILLLKRIRESLAGRVFLYELWPLMASELRTPHTDTPPLPLVGRLLEAGTEPQETFEQEPAVLLGTDEDACRSAIEHLARWGGMPGLLPLDEADRKNWLRSYQRTYLERDLADLARLDDLEPFRKLQELIMLRTGQLRSYSGLARDAQISVSTAKRYVEYLELSYQVVLLRPFSENLTSAVVKSPKAYWLDLGLLRQATLQFGQLTGAMFETLVVSEFFKWVRTRGADARLSFYRTRSGMELDLLVQTPTGFLGFEVKNRTRVHDKDLRSLKAVADALGERWRGGGVIYRGATIEPLDRARGLWAIPVHRLF